MAARTRNRLTDLAIRKAKKAAWLADGGGLYLRVDAGGAKKWVYVFQWQGKRAEMGLGSLADVNLPDARDKRDAARKHVVEGRNPIEERKREREAEEAAEAGAVTFGEWAEEIAPSIGPRAPKARKAWLAMMKVKVGALAGLSPGAIQTEHVLVALKPYWESRPESGRRMRQRIERVLDAARAKGLIQDPWNNPAKLRNHLENLLSQARKPVRHHAALPYAEAPQFMVDLRAMDRPAAAALEFVVLTAVRNGEARKARAREVDFKAKTWTIPAERMKGPLDLRKDHRVTLSDAALAVLERVKPPEGWTPDALLFPCPKARTGYFSENALGTVLNDMGLKGRATVHGFRSTFRDWAGDCTNFARETIEACLSHKIKDDTERAYRRSDALLKRQKLMDAWAGYLDKPSAANVRTLSRRPA